MKNNANPEAQKGKEILERLKSFNVLDIKAGDTIVLSVKSRLTLDAQERARHYLKEQLKDAGIKNVNVIVLDIGMDLGILRSSCNGNKGEE